jgi:hypothetical protein
MTNVARLLGVTIPGAARVPYVPAPSIIPVQMPLVLGSLLALVSL